MNAGLPDRTDIGPVSRDQYPEHYVFQRSDLESLDTNPQSARVLAQLCDVLMLFEKACARSLSPNTQPVAQCTVFILEIFLKMIEAERQSTRKPKASDF
ncbi:MAG: hypothetical protein B7Y80_17710 [Hyphomicrobium sp. 32-62-53]|jgi:hypothetical protein|nr:MAG: hypothetical protein B7Y80_17710 [Hyphomicrobium sp. 32-62-53]